MKRNDIKALHEKTIIELNKDLDKLLMDLAKARLEKGAMKLANVSLVARLSDDVARLKTIIREKEFIEKAQELLATLKEEVGVKEEPEAKTKTK